MQNKLLTYLLTYLLIKLSEQIGDGTGIMSVHFGPNWVKIINTENLRQKCNKNRTLWADGFMQHAAID